MFKKRNNGEVVIKIPGAGFTGVPMVIQLVGEREELSRGFCDNPECREWEMFNVYNPKTKKWEPWHSHIEECQMLDFTPENVSEAVETAFEFGKRCASMENLNKT
ncbi:MAG: hypothetical protein IBX72_14330 [Nitrospirae bacterium]|nr:hypothetical protein [Nitrospirota bacterium]MBE0427807.1 hypothetical protein [Nitrospirota bacterium]